MVNDEATIDPRWGNANRDAKGRAILRTLELYFRKPLRDSAWLDVGCGSGGIAAELASSVKSISGVDPEMWKKWSDFEAQHSNLKFFVANYSDLSRLFPREEIDVVICNQVYEHVDDPKKLLGAIASILNDQGVCYFAGPNLLWPIEPHVFWPIVHWLPRSFAHKVMRAFGSNKAVELDAYSWNYWRLTRAFRKAGFKHRSAIRERLLGGGQPNPIWLQRLIASIPNWVYSIISPFAPGFVFVLVKSSKPRVRV